jgi:hypothetical protein
MHCKLLLLQLSATTARFQRYQPMLSGATLIAQTLLA